MPKKTKKSGGGGKTEEEKLLTLQKSARAAEENARKREEVFTLFLKDKLQKEERNTAVNLLKLNDGWRSILRQTRAAELRDDVTVLAQTFERQLDGLSSVVQSLECDLQAADRQGAQARRVHLQHLERLQAQQDTRLTLVQQRWEGGLQDLSCGFDSERKQMLSRSERRRAELEDATFIVGQRHKAVMDETHRLYRDVILAYECAYNDRKAKLNEASDDAQRGDQLAALSCDRESKQLDELMARNQESIQLTEAHMKRVKKQQDLVLKLRERLTSSAMENQLMERDLTGSRNRAIQRTRELREQLTRAQAAARKRLTDLTVQSDKTAKKLLAVIAKGEKVLRVMEVCQKLESEQQNLSLTWFSTEEPGPETEEPETVEALEFPELRQLQRRINAAVLQREALRKHKDDLSRENQQLRLLLRQHLDAMTVNDNTLDGPHALLAVNPAPTLAPTDAIRRCTVIEAVHAIKHSL